MQPAHFPFGTPSPREIQVLALLARGVDFKDIPAHLPIAGETARTYFKRFARKVGARHPLHAMSLFKELVHAGTLVPNMVTTGRSHRRPGRLS